MEASEDEAEFLRSAISSIKDLMLLPFRILTSPTLLRTYIRTVLVFFASVSLFAVAVIAYTSFYYTYVPARGVDVPVYLQFDARSDRFPYGIAKIREDLMSRQKYDVLVDIELPRSEGNLALGNWMVGVELKGPGDVAVAGVKQMLGFTEEWDVEDYSFGSDGASEKEERTPEEASGAADSEKNGKVIARSRRPAILTYRSWMTEMVYRATRMPLYLVGWRQEAETVSVRVMESVEFEKGWKNMPKFLRLETRSRAPLEVYKVQVKFVAQFEGLRYIMYNHRIISLILFTSVFWFVSMMLLFLTWGVFSFLFSSPSSGRSHPKIKHEPDVPETPKTAVSSAPSTPLSDTSRTFPTLPSQAPLRYSSAEGKVKAEQETPRLEEPPVKEEEADDEDEDADFVLDEPVPGCATGIIDDSGIGTSMESSVEHDRGLRRRSSGRGSH